MKLHTLLLPLLALVPALALAQGDSAPSSSGPPAERINQVIVYGDDPCPKGEGDDIVVCMRSKDDPARIPTALRSDPNAPANQAWGVNARSVEYAGRTGIGSCTPVGPGGMTGCFNQIVREARADRAQEQNGGWAELVAAERAKRLGGIDAESNEVEKQALEDEAADNAANAASAAADAAAAAATNTATPQ